MAKHLNPLEKEFLIRRYRSNPRIPIKDFCESNGITDNSLKKWMKQYDEGGLDGLVRAGILDRGFLYSGSLQKTTDIFSECHRKCNRKCHRKCR